MDFLEDIDAHRGIVKRLVHYASANDVALVQAALDACAGISLENALERSMTSSLPTAVEGLYWLRKVIELTALAFQSPLHRPSFFRALHKARVGMLQAMHFWMVAKESYPHLRHQKCSESTDESFSSFSHIREERKKMTLQESKKEEQEVQSLDWLCQYVDSLEAVENMWYDVQEASPWRSIALKRRMKHTSESSDGVSSSLHASLLPLQWKRILTSERLALIREIHLAAKEWMQRLRTEMLASFSLGWYSLTVLYSYISFCCHCLQLSAELWISSISDCSRSRATAVGLPGMDISYIGTRLCLGRRVLDQFDRLQALWHRRVSRSHRGNVRLANAWREKDPLSGGRKALGLDRPYPTSGKTASEEWSSSRSSLPTTSLTGATCNASLKSSEEVHVSFSTASAVAEKGVTGLDTPVPEGPALPAAPQGVRSTCPLPSLYSTLHTRELSTPKSTVATESSESAGMPPSAATEKEDDAQSALRGRFSSLPFQVLQTYHRIQCRVVLLCVTSLPLGKLIGLSQQFRKQVHTEWGIPSETRQEGLPRRQVFSPLQWETSRSWSVSSDKGGEADEKRRLQEEKGHTRRDGQMMTTQVGGEVHDSGDGAPHRFPVQPEGSSLTGEDRGSKETRRDRIVCDGVPPLHPNSAASHFHTNAPRTTLMRDPKAPSSSSRSPVASFPLLCEEDGVAQRERKTFLPISTTAMGTTTHSSACRSGMAPRCSLSSSPPWLSDLFPNMLQEDPTLCAAWKDVLLDGREDGRRDTAPTLLIASWEGEMNPQEDTKVVHMKNENEKKSVAFSSLSSSPLQPYIHASRDECRTSVSEANLEERRTNCKMEGMSVASPSISTNTITEKEENKVEKEGSDARNGGHHPNAGKMLEVPREIQGKDDDAYLEACKIRMIWPFFSSSSFSQEESEPQQMAKSVDEYDHVRYWLSVVGHPIAALAKSDSGNKVVEGASQTTFLNSTHDVEEENKFCVLFSYSEECCAFFHFPSSTEVYVRRWGKEITGFSKLFFVVAIPSTYPKEEGEMLQKKSFLVPKTENGDPLSESPIENGGEGREAASSSRTVMVTRRTTQCKKRLEMLNRLYSAWIGECHW